MKEMQDLLDDMNKRMAGAENNLKNVLSGLRTGRVSTGLLEHIKVDAYGNFMTINQLGSVNILDTKMLLVKVWDRSLAKSVEKAIADAGLGLNPITEGDVIRVPIPDLSEERRRELSKKAASCGEDSKIAIRNIRRDTIDKLRKMEKNKLISEDDLKTNSDKVQEITDKHVKILDEMVKNKTKDIMAI